MSNQKTVSVCMITYKHEEFIEEAIQSIIDQKTTFDFELIIGEDFSPDNTRILCEKMAEQYPDKIRLLPSEQNWGMQPNVIRVLSACDGKYIAMCEGDDYWTDPLKLQKQVDFLEQNPECVSCHHWQKYTSKNEQGVFEEYEAPTKNQGYLNQPKATVRAIFNNKLRVKTRTHLFRNVIEHFPDWFYTVAYGDVPLSMLLGQYGQFGFINEEMAVYRITGEGASSEDSGKQDYFYLHFIKWVKVWEYGLKHFDYKYDKEGISTIIFFYKKIITESRPTIRLVSNLVFYICFKSTLKWRYRPKILVHTCYCFLKSTLKKG